MNQDPESLHAFASGVISLNLSIRGKIWFPWSGCACEFGFVNHGLVAMLIFFSVLGVSRQLEIGWPGSMGCHLDFRQESCRCGVLFSPPPRAGRGRRNMSPSALMSAAMVRGAWACDLSAVVSWWLHVPTLFWAFSFIRLLDQARKEKILLNCTWLSIGNVF